MMYLRSNPCACPKDYCCPTEEPTPGVGMCPCCVRSLAIIIERLSGATVTFKLTSQPGSGLLNNVTVINLKNGYLVEIERTSGPNTIQSFINICEIVTITGDAVATIDYSGINEENCGCCEQALTDLIVELDNNNSTFDMYTLNPGTDSSITVATINNIVPGVVRVNTNKLVSLCNVSWIDDVTPKLP